MNKTVFILISIALLLIILFVPNYCPSETPGETGKWEMPLLEVRLLIFATIILPVFFIITYSNTYEFNVIPEYIPFIERKNLWGTFAFIVLCAGNLFLQLTLAVSTENFPLEKMLGIFALISAVLIALRSMILDGVWGLHLNSNFSDRLIKFFRTVIILLFIVAVALSFVLPLFSIDIPSTAQIDQLLPDVQFVVNEDFTATFSMLLTAGALALVVAIFAINQVAGIFGGFAAAVSDVARGDFGGATTRSKKVNCHNCKSFHFDSKGKPSCYTCGRLWSTTQDCPYYDEK